VHNRWPQKCNLIWIVFVFSAVIASIVRLVYSRNIGSIDGSCKLYCFTLRNSILHILLLHKKTFFLLHDQENNFPRLTLSNL
jgi:hypothetical protein